LALFTQAIKTTIDSNIQMLLSNKYCGLCHYIITLCKGLKALKLQKLNAFEDVIHICFLDHLC